MSDAHGKPGPDITGSGEPGAGERGEPVEPVHSVHGCAAAESCGQLVVHPTREQYVELVRRLADDGYVMCVDITAVDYLLFMQRSVPEGITPERFEVVVNLLDLANRRRLRLRVQVPDSDPTLPTLFDLHPGTEAMEREVFDMFGIVFTDHPDPSRILMPEDWDGHPLRKDYEIGEIPVQFKAARS
jgi:NADH-quinone oxidoreductase subunit C